MFKWMFTTTSNTIMSFCPLQPPSFPFSNIKLAFNSRWKPELVLIFIVVFFVSFEKNKIYTKKVDPPLPPRELETYALAFFNDCYLAIHHPKALI